MNVRAVDPQRSRIVLVGAPTYSDTKLPDVPEVAANVRDLARLFTDPHSGGFPRQNCTIAPATASLADIGDLVNQAAEQAEDLLLFYYAGHGIVGRRTGELYLALHQTRYTAPEYSALPFETVRGTFLDSRASNRVVILDSCFSGRAIAPTLGAEGQAALGQIEIRGTYTLASAPPNSLALVRPGESHTAFTGRLITLLTNGVPNAGNLLSMDEIYRNLFARLRSDGLPEPQRVGTANAELLGLVRNRYAAKAKDTSVDLWESFKNAADVDALPGIILKSTLVILDAAKPGQRDPAMVRSAATSLRRMTPERAAAALAPISPATAADIVREMEVGATVKIFDQLNDDFCINVMTNLPIAQVTALMRHVRQKHAAAGAGQPGGWATRMLAGSPDPQELFGAISSTGSSRPLEGLAAFLCVIDSEHAAPLIRAMTPKAAAAVLKEMAPDEAAKVLNHIDPVWTASALALMPAEQAYAVVRHMTTQAASSDSHG